MSHMHLRKSREIDFFLDTDEHHYRLAPKLKDSCSS